MLSSQHLCDVFTGLVYLIFAVPRSARVLSGRAEPEPTRTSVDLPMRRSRHEGRFLSRRAVLHPSKKHVLLASLRRSRLPQLQELHPDEGDHDAGPLCLRRHLRRHGHEQSMAAPVFGRMGFSRSHGPLRQKPGVGDWVAPLARMQRR